MQKSDFVHLHLHTQYSILDGAIKIDQLVERAKELNMTSVAITDHGNMFGAFEFYNACKKEGIKPIIGQEFYVAKGSRFDRKDATEKGNYHLVLLAKNPQGLKNLMKLSSIGFIEGFYYKPRIDKEVLEKYSEGLIALSACVQGEIPKLILEGREDEALKAASWFRDIFGDDFYLEVQYHGLDSQKKANEGVFQIARKLGINVVATNDAHYLKAEDWEAHDVLLCLQTGKKLEDENRMRFPSKEFYVKDALEMLKVFPDNPEAILNTLEVAEKVQDVAVSFKGYLLPKYEVPGGLSYSEYLRKLAIDGLQKRFKELGIKDAAEKRKYMERLEHELKIINDMGFPGYFLIVWDFINWAKKNKIPVGPGRGSAAGSLVAYAIGITDINPLQFNLLFERFLNPERVTMPDIDVDICKEGRGKVIDYVRQKYGEDRVCQIITFGTLQPRMVIRDVGRVLNMPYSEVDKIAKLVPKDALTIESALEKAPELKDMSEKEPKIKKMLDIASKLQGLVRQTGIHAAGVVIAPQPLTELIPLARGKEGEVTTQYEMGQVEKLGLLKMDFLGLKTLTIIDKTEKLIRQEHKNDFDARKIPLDDEKTYELLKSGNTVGVFQLESPGMRKLLKRLNPSNIFDIVAILALYRPGPLNSGMVDSYIRRKNGQEEVDYIFPELEPILKETYGLFIYQEQIMQIANVLAGYSLGEADLLRRAMGKKKKEIMEEQRSKFISRAVERGYPKEKIEKLFDDIAKFAEYGFNKSHSAAYAILAYTTAYLKAHYPREFYTSMFSIELGQTDEIVKLVKDCRENGIQILPPDVNKSGVKFEIEGKSIRFGLAGIKGVGEKAAEEIVKARREKGDFEELYDFCEKVDLRVVNKKVIESLIKAGAFDFCKKSRASLLSTLDRAMKAAQSVQNSSAMPSLFGEKHSKPQRIYEDKGEFPDRIKLELERSAIGFYFSGHPLDGLKEICPLELKMSQKLPSVQDKQTVRFAGIITSVEMRRTQRGDRWASVEVSDLEGFIRVLIFPNVFSQVSELISEGSAVAVEGEVKQEENGVSVIARHVRLLEKEISEGVSEVVIKLSSDDLKEDKLSELKKLLKEHNSLNGKPVVIEIKSSGYEARLLTHREFHIPVEAALMRKLKRFLGEGKVQVVG